MHRYTTTLMMLRAAPTAVLVVVVVSHFWAKVSVLTVQMLDYAGAKMTSFKSL